MPKELECWVDDVLIAHLSADLVATVRRLLDRGERPSRIIATAKRAEGRRGPQTLGVEALCERWAAGREAGAN
jgi:hypothetical protein